MTAYTKFKEYIWLIETIQRAGKLTLAEINELWLDTEISGGVDLSRTTFNRHRDAILDIFGIIIECNRKDGNRYYIENERVLNEDSIQTWMLSTLSVGNMLSESKGLQNRILLENVPSGGEMLQQVIKAMNESHKIQITYHRYMAPSDSSFTIDPYCLKLFRQRWYMLGKLSNGFLSTFSFDRILSVEVLEEKFKMDKDFDASDFFSESYGIVVDDKIAVERVVLRAYSFEPYNLRDLPLHSSQQEINTTEDYADFELYLRPTSDFKTKLLSRGEWLEVLEPQWLAEEIRNWHQAAIDRYKNKEN